MLIQKPSTTNMPTLANPTVQQVKIVAYKSTYIEPKNQLVCEINWSKARQSYHLYVYGRYLVWSKCHLSIHGASLVKKWGNQVDTCAGKQAHIRHLHWKTTLSSCHRCL